MGKNLLISLGAPSTQERRKRRFAYALSAGVVSKILATVVQLLALPLALRALGADRYAAFLTLQAFVGWTGLLGLGLVPSLPRFIAEAHTHGDQATERDLVQAVGLFMAGVFLVLAIGLFMLAALISPMRLLAIHGIGSSEAITAYGVVVIATGLQIATSIVPAIRGGYQELHYTYVWSTFASIMVGLGLILISARKPSIAAFMLVLYSPLVVLMLMDAVVITFQKPYLATGRAKLAQAARILAPHAANALAIQIEFFLVSYLPTIIVAHMNGPRATTIFGSILQLLILAGSGMNLIFQPLVPAIANAHAQHDLTWVRKAYYRAALIVGSICFVGISVNIAAGSFLIRKWLHTDLEIPHALPIVLALYFAFWMSSMLHFNVLAATGNLLRTSRIYILEGIVAITLGTVLSHFYGVTGMAVGMLIATAGISGWCMPYLVSKRVLRRDHA